MRTFIATLLLTAIFIVNGCAITSPSSGALESDAGWAILPFTSSGMSSLAERKTGSLVETHLRARGVRDIANFSSVADTQARSEARSAGNRYGITGVVNRWDSGGVIGRHPKVGVDLQVIDLVTGELLWSENKSQIGRVGGLARVANRAVASLVKRLPLKRSQGGRAVGTASPSASSTEIPTLAKALAANPDPAALESLAVAGRGVAIYYGAKPPTDILANFDRLILEPDNITTPELKALTSKDAVPYAYLSVGEVGPHRAYASKIRQEWVLGENTVWKSKVLDLANPGWVDFLLGRIDELQRAGYQGLFLDTMDSYQIYATTPEAKRRQEQALVQFLKTVKQRHPGIRLIANRGFEVMAQGAQYLEAIAAESLYASWDNAAAAYVDVKPQDREWLLSKLKQAQTEHSLEVISIEYLPPDRREEAKKVAGKIAALGFIPWVSTPSLDYVGVGLMEVKPRGVLMLYDSRSNGELQDTVAHLSLSTIIEYFGYVPIMFDMARQPLPTSQLKGVYAGVVSWTFSDFDIPGYADFLEKQIRSSVPVALMGGPGFRVSGEMAGLMGLKTPSGLSVKTAKPTTMDSLIGFDKKLTSRLDNLMLDAQSVSQDNTVHLSFEDAAENRADLVVTGPWGGLAMDPAVIFSDFDEKPYWILDPFKFLQTALQLEALPMPDVTTQNGRRLWLAHIDGDALPSWAEMPGRLLGAEVIKQQLLDKYRLPHTVSIVEGEMVSFAKYFDRHKRMFDVARQIFALPHVEIATHTYSHPYSWQKVASHQGSGRYNLPVAGYQYDARREIGGSADFINKQLAPKNKKTEVILWSGDGLPKLDAMQATEEAGLVNMNGGFTTIRKSHPSHFLITPMARQVGPYLQVYAPIMNENVYTDDWRGPFDGFRDVIDTMSMTDKPRRLKPINIYYHFYAGTKIATMKAMNEIYDWTISQEINPVYVSEYARKVPDFRSAGLARYVNGEWKLNGLGNVSSIRILDDKLWPTVTPSSGVVGARQLHDGIYIHTDGSDSVTFRLGNEPPQQNHLVSSNGQVESWQVSGASVSFRIKGHVPVELELGGRGSGLCNISSNGQLIRGKRTANNTTLFSFLTRDTGNAILNCQA